MSHAPSRSQIAAALRGLEGMALAHDAEAVRGWLSAARDEGVDALLARHWLQALSRDPQRRAVVVAVLTQCAKEELARQVAEQRVIKALRVAEIPFLVLKGAALSRWLYAERHQRPRCDLDLLFRSEAGVVQAQTALAPVGYAWDGVLGIGPAYERTLLGAAAGMPHQVDAHWRMANHPAFAHAFAFDELLQHGQPLPDFAGAYGLGAVHALLHACLHRVANMLFDFENRLIWLYDIHLLAQRMSEPEWSTFTTVAVDRGAAGACLDALDACAELLATTTPLHVRSALADAARSESFRISASGRRRAFEQQMLRTLPWQQWPGYAVQKLLPSFVYMRQHHGIERRSQLPIAYLRRALSGLKFLIERDRSG